MDEEVKTDAVIEPTEVLEEKKGGFKLDSNRSLTSQVNNLLKTLPDNTEEPPKEEAIETPVEEVKTELEESAKQAEENVEEAPDELELEDLPEEKSLEPLPEWSKYVLEKLPNIQVRGHEGEEGNDKVFIVKRLEDLPDNFEFESKRAEIAFTQALAAQEINARDLLNQYKQEESQRAQKDFEALEAVDIQNDITNLQRSGLLDKFKYQVNDRRFNDDPAVKESNKIYEYYKELNQEYYNKYNGSGRMYRVSYEDAAYRYYALHPKEAPVEKKVEAKPEKKTQTQEERERVATKVSAPQGSNAEGRNKPLPPGTPLSKIYQAYKRGLI